MKKMFGVLIMAAVLSASAFGAGNRQTGERPVTFSLWDEVQFPVFREIIEQFTSRTGIEVELQLTPWSHYWMRLDAASTAGTAADVIWMNINLPRYADAGIVEPIEPFFVRDNLDRNNWSKSMIDLYTYRGQIYAMPKGMDVVAVAYNKALFDRYGVPYPQEGWAWADFRRTGIQLRDSIRVSGGGEYPVVMELDAQPSYLQFWLQDGVIPYSPASTSTQLSRPEAARAFHDVLSLMEENIMPNFTVLSDTKGTDLFISGRAGMVFVGSWKSVVLDDASFASQIGLIPMPSRSVSNVVALGGISYALNAAAANKEASWQLIKFLGGLESNRMQAEGRIDIPAYLDAQQYYIPAFKNIDPTAFVTQSRTATVFPSHSRLHQWNMTMNDISVEIWSKSTTPEDGMRRLSAEIDRILSSR